jgi:hypothetical protein
MTFTPIGSVTNKDLGQTLFLYQQQGFTSLVNNDVKDWASLEAIMDPTGVGAKGFQYALEPSRRPSNVQMVNPSSRDRLMISGRGDDIVTVQATSKVIEVVAQFDDDVYKRAMMDPTEIHVAPMQLAMWNQTMNLKEGLLKQYYQDGSGVQATVHSTPAITISGGKATISLYNQYNKRGADIYFIEEQDIIFASTAGIQHFFRDGSAANIPYYRITNVDYENHTITVDGRSSTGALVAIVDNSHVSLSIVAEDVIYNNGDLAQTVLPDLTGSVDYGSCLYSPGLASLGAADGRLLRGLTMSGVYAGTQVDNLGATLDSKAVTALYAKLYRRVGEGKYDYPFMKTSFKTFKHLIDSDEGSVVFQPQQRERGGKKINVAFGDSETELCYRRFVPDYQIWAEPKLNDTMAAPGGLSKPVLQLQFSGFDFITDPSDNKIFRQKLVGGVRAETWECHMKTFFGFVASQSAAIGSITNFKIG